jgi:hypothetical protein
MHVSTKSPVMGYKIAIVNNANLNQQYVVIQPAVYDEEGKVITPEKSVQQFVYASKRLMRAVRKARTMLGSYKYIQLFGQRQDGSHFPVSLKKRTQAPVRAPEVIKPLWDQKNAQGETMNDIMVEKIRERNKQIGVA